MPLQVERQVLTCKLFLRYGHGPPASVDVDSHGPGPYTAPDFIWTLLSYVARRLDLGKRKDMLIALTAEERN
jgi:hypothetical protein